MSNGTLYNFLLSHSRKNTVSFHMPGHKGEAFYRDLGYDDFLDYIMNLDITEIKGADNLFQAEGILKEIAEGYSNLYDAKKSYLLINGSSGGIIAAILSSVAPSKKLILARNSHKSIFNSLTLGNIRPVYAYPEILSPYGISGSITKVEISKLLIENPDADAVILPSPNYYGICSDIKGISEVVHKHNKILIVDQAHGAHLKMFSKFGIEGFPEAAEDSGADMVINSTHKTLGSFTQSAILNVMSDRVDLSTLEDKLQMIESTSPSYLLLASLDINRKILAEHGKALMTSWASDLDYFYREAVFIEGLGFIDRFPLMDSTKLDLFITKPYLTGSHFEDLLIDRNIYPELNTGDFIVLMSGVGNKRKDYGLLLDAIYDISKDKNIKEDIKVKADNISFASSERKPIYDIPLEKVKLPVMDAEGFVCAQSIIPYPPGIPLVCPGEKYDKNTLLHIKELRAKGEKVIGVNEKGEILCGRSEA